MLEATKTEIGSVRVSELGRTGLGELIGDIKQVRGGLDALEVQALVEVDRLGDGGAGSAELVRSAGGCSQREARRRARRAEALAEMPSVAGALSEGDITVEHADALVKAAEATSAAAVNSDEGLLSKAKSLPADLAGREARDWAHRCQSVEDREARFRRQRAMRSHRMWIDDQGMFNSHARLDPVTGAKFKAVVGDVADKFHRADGGRDRGDRVRSWQQRNADALVSAVGAEPGPGTSGNGDGPSDRRVEPGPGPAPFAATATPATGPAGRDLPELSRRNQLVVIAETGVITGADPDGRCEIPGVGPIPRSEMERLACGADLFGVLFDGEGVPLWHGRKLRTASDQQWRALLARDRGCVLCGADPSHCHAHHIIPWTAPARGLTDIDNLALVCNRHHHHVHQHNLTLDRGPGGRWTTRGPDADAIKARANCRG